MGQLAPIISCSPLGHSEHKLQVGPPEPPEEGRVVPPVLPPAPPVAGSPPSGAFSFNGDEQAKTKDMSSVTRIMFLCFSREGAGPYVGYVKANREDTCPADRLGQARGPAHGRQAELSKTECKEACALCVMEAEG